jgi:signal transduction histidine kinase
MFGREADGLAGEAAATFFGSPLDALAVEGATRELSGIRRDGSRFPVQIAIGKTLAEDPDIRVVTVRDLSGLRSMESRLRDAIAAAALAEEHARQELAADLHDDVGQLLSLAALRIGRLRAAGDEERLNPDALVEIEECVRLAQKHCGSLAFQLSPPLLRDVGLAAATEWLAEDLERTYGLSVRVRSDGEPSLSEAVRSAAFRAVRELLINAARHADARVVLATLSCSEGRLVIAVEDDGLGFEPELDRRGFGLLHITERITALGGRFEIASSAGCGTRARLVLPLCGADASPASD